MSRRLISDEISQRLSEHGIGQDGFSSICRRKSIPFVIDEYEIVVFIDTAYERHAIEDRQDLLGHKSNRITTHYSALDMTRLIEAAESVCTRPPNTGLRIAAHTNLTQFENSDSTVKEGHA